VTTTPRRPATTRQWRGAAGWAVISSGHTQIVFSLVILAAGIAAFLAWARAEREWPFGPKHIREEFREPSPSVRSSPAA
jgi:fructoselysine transporter